ncbi:lamin tail domain-containing protein [Candidatus Saccharibacteria bacterium]|nr:lamin tail domain-containing protein [Candidatus Saccharibacteria bacterium]
MKRIAIALILSAIGLLNISAASIAYGAATSGNQLKISALYLGSNTDAEDEYITIQNSGTTEIDITGMEIDYKSATGKSWYTKARIGDKRLLAAGGEITASAKRSSDITLSSGLAQSGGNIRISLAGVITDAIAWGNGDSPEGRAVAAPKPGEEIVRACEISQVCFDTQDNSKDFRILPLTTANQVGMGGVAIGDSTLSTQQSQAAEADIEITELLPDPVSPQVDSKDEFIELYNAGANPARLIGWKLTEGKHSYSLDKLIINPGQYVVVYARDSKMSLNNSGDTISLINPSGQTIMTTPNYGKAQAGKSFGVTPQGWGWLTSATPGSTNASLDNAQSDEKTSSVKSSAKQSATSKRSSSKTSPKLAKVAEATAKNAGAANSSEPPESTSIPWTWLLGGLAIVTIGYAGYEYRPEIIAFITKLRAKLSTRGDAR